MKRAHSVRPIRFEAAKETTSCVVFMCVLSVQKTVQEPINMMIRAVILRRCNSPVVLAFPTHGIPRIPRPFDSTYGRSYSRTNLIDDRGRRSRRTAWTGSGTGGSCGADMIAGWPPVRARGGRMLSDKS